MIDKKQMQKGIKPIDFFRWMKYKLSFSRNNPNFFYPSGLTVFTGPQGSGKTLSAVLYVRNLMKNYPKCILVTNVDIKEYPVDHVRVFPFLDNDDFMKYSNGTHGVIYLVDEIQLYLNSLKSKNVNLDVVTELSQQRKQRKHIVATSQIFGRMAKPLREQFSEVVACRNYLGWLQCNMLIDRDSIQEGDASDTNIKGDVKAKFWYVHSPTFYGIYDTYSKIERGKFVAGEEKGVDIYDNNDFRLPSDS